MTTQYKVITHQGKNDYVCEIILKEGSVSESTSSITTVIIMDRSGSMGSCVPKLINEVFPQFFSKLNYNQSDNIHIITFDSVIEHLTLQVSQFKTHSMFARGSTEMQGVMKELESIFNSGNQKYRILTISDGDVFDQEETLDKATQLANKIRGKFTINSQAVRLITSGQPDTRALSAMLSFNTLNKFGLEDIDAHLESGEMAEILANLFRKDSLEYDLVFKVKDKCIKEDLWSPKKDILILRNGTNTFWMDTVDKDNMNILVKGNTETPQILKSTPLDKTSYQKILQDKINGYIQRIKVLKVLGTADAENEINSIIKGFQQYEKDIIGNTSNPNSVTAKMNNIACHDLNSCDNKQKAEFIQSNEGLNEDNKLDPRFTKIDPTDFYDIIIKATNFEDLADQSIGWSIFKSSEASSDYQSLVKEQMPVIGVVGVGNRGKSYILSKVSGFVLPEGYSVETQGLSLKYLKGEGKKFILLDSAGSSTPLLETNKFKLSEIDDLDKARKRIEEVSRDKTMIEMFLQNFVILKSQVILAVVGQMTYNEQKLLKRLKKFVNKRLIIVHNLMNFVLIKQVEDYIENVLKKIITFDLKENKYVVFSNTKGNEKIKGNQRYFNEQIIGNDGKEKNIDHIILASDLDDSETKEYYNESGFAFLKSLLTADVGSKKFDVVQSLKDYLGKQSNEIMEQEISPNEHVFVEDDKMIIKNTNLKLKKIIFSEMGESSFIGSGYEPKCGIWIEKDPKDEKKKKLVIEVEVVGETNSTTVSNRSHGEYILFHIKGTKSIPKVDGELLVEYNMKNENFDFRIKTKHLQFDRASQTIEYLKSAPKGKNASGDPVFNGIVRISYTLEEEEEADGEEEFDF